MTDKKELYKSLVQEVKKHQGKEVIVVCIGTDRSTGDSFGPFVGTFLSERKLKNMKVVGTIDDPVHALNIEEKMNKLYKNHPNAFIIAVDASLGAPESIRKTFFYNTPIRPGAAVGKDLPPVGNCCLKGVVNVSGLLEALVLSNTRLSIVIEMAKECAEVVKKLDTYLAKSIRKQQALLEVASTKETV